MLMVAECQGLITSVTIATLVIMPLSWTLYEVLWCAGVIYCFLPPWGGPKMVGRGPTAEHMK